MNNPKELAPESLTVKEAIEQGYETYIKEGNETAGHLTDIERDGTDLTQGVWWIMEKEGRVMTVSAEDIYEDLADNLACNHDLYDDDNSFRDLIAEAIDWESVAAQVNEKLKQRPVYYPTDIKLIP